MLPIRSRAALVALLAPLAGLAQGSGAEAPYTLEVKVGEAVELCKTGTIRCPASSPICDDPAVAVPGSSAAGLVFKGVAPGTTLCSAGTDMGQGSRRVYRVVVTRARAQ